MNPEKSEPFLPTREQLPLNPIPLEDELAIVDKFRDLHENGDFQPAFWSWVESVLITGPQYEKIISNQLNEIERLKALV